MKIIVKNPCGCLELKNQIPIEQEFETKEEAIEVAKEILKLTKSKKFCQTHQYSYAIEDGDIIFRKKLNFDI